MPLCPSCTLIDVKLLKASVAVPVLFKASFTELELSAQTGCPLCQLVKTTIEASTKSGNTKTPGRAVYYSAVEIKDPNTNIPSLNSLLVSCMGRSGYLILAPNKIPTKPNLISGRLVPPSPDLRWAQNALSNCVKNHTQCNKMLTGEPAPTDPYLPPRVYDIFQKCLRPGSAVIDGQYAALSYVWGHSTALWDSRTLKTNLNQRLLNLEADQFPKTYSTAIAIASTLGFRYIWIDSLCILQDDDDDKRDNFTNHMSNIYQNAQITITSVKESANEECLASRQVATLKDAVSFVNDMIYAVPSMGNPAIDIGGESPSGPLWSNRGWTFQERLLSPRCLYFTGSQMYFECRQQLVAETGLQHFTSIYKRLDYTGKIKEQLEKNWPAMVRDYSKRQLSQHTDRIPAILGIASQICSPTVDPAVSFGFFSDRLTIDILWEADGQPLTPQELPMDSKLLPTWSWARWMGKVGWETYLETSKPCIQITPDIHGALIAKKAKVVEIRVGAPRTAPSGPDWIVWGVDHQNMFDIIFPNQQDSVKGWGTFDVDPSNDLDEKRLSCILISEAADSDKGSKSKIKRCSNLLLVSYDSSVYRRRGVGQVTMDEALFDNVKESDILIL